MLHLEHSFLWCWKFDIMPSGSEIHGKFGDVVLEKVGEVSLDQSCKKRRSVPYSKEREKHPAYILGFT